MRKWFQNLQTKALIFSFVFSFLTSVNIAFAAEVTSPVNYKAALVIIENGKTVAQPSLTLTEMKPTSVIQDLKVGKVEIEILPVAGMMNGKKGIILSFQVRKIAKDGAKTLMSEPGVLAQLNKLVTANIGPVKKEKTIQVSITLTK
jgi:hypothetical protein